MGLGFRATAAIGDTFPNHNDGSLSRNPTFDCVGTLDLLGYLASTPALQSSIRAGESKVMSTRIGVLGSHAC